MAAPRWQLSPVGFLPYSLALFQKNLMWKWISKRRTRFRDADQILVFMSLSWQYETNLEAVFCVFQQFSGFPRFRAHKNEHNLQPGALKVTNSEFFLTKSVSHLCHFVERWEKIWSKSWYHMTSRDLSQGSGHRKFELSSLGIKITIVQLVVSLSKRDLSHQNSLYIDLGKFIDRVFATVDSGGYKRKHITL